MNRNEIRECINEYLQVNKVTTLTKSVSKGIQSYLCKKYPNEQYGSIYKIEVNFMDFCTNGSISGLVKRCDPFEPNHIIDCVDFEINPNMEVMAYDKECFVLTLDVENLSRDDMIDLKYIANRYHRIDIYRTFMRVKPTSRGKLAELIENCLEHFDYDIPPYSFCKYNGQFLHTTNRAVGDIGGGMGFGGFIREYGNIAEIPYSVVSIGEHAFDGCKNLKEVYIKEKVHYIGKHAFSNIAGLTIYCSVSSKPSQWDDEWCDENCKIIWG